MTNASKRYQVETWTLCQGWINSWTVDDESQTFATAEEAESEIDALLADIEHEIATGSRDADAGYRRSEFRVVAVA